MEIDPAYQELLGKLEQLRGPARKKVVRKSLRKMGELVQSVVVAMAPVQVSDVHGVLPAGALKEDIKVRVHIGADESAAADSDRVTIGPTRRTVDIAIDVETGHDNRPRTTPRKPARVERTPPHPFVRPAFDASKDAALYIFEETMTAEIRKVMNA